MIPGKLMGIDHGLARIGLAVCDPTGLVARELAIIKRRSKREDFDKINRYAANEGIVGLVIGLPHNPDAHPDAPSQAETVKRWVEHLRSATDLPIIFWDEQLSSVDALELAQQKKRKRGEPIDDLAARVILQSYLDALRAGLAPPFPDD